MLEVLDRTGSSAKAVPGLWQVKEERRVTRGFSGCSGSHKVSPTYPYRSLPEQNFR